MPALSLDPIDDFINALREFGRRPSPEVLRVVAECSVPSATEGTFSWTASTELGSGFLGAAGPSQGP
jgi:hypothetical protein